MKKKLQTYYVKKRYFPSVSSIGPTVDWWIERHFLRQKFLYPGRGSNSNPLITTSLLYHWANEATWWVGPQNYNINSITNDFWRKYFLVLFGPFRNRLFADIRTSFQWGFVIKYSLVPNSLKTHAWRCMTGFYDITLLGLFSQLCGSAEEFRGFQFHSGKFTEREENTWLTLSYCYTVAL